jgi:hypothetical protein
VSRLQAANDCFQAWASHSGHIIENFDEVRPGKSRSTPDIVKFPVQRIILVHSGECVELAASDALPGVRRAEVLPYLHRFQSLCRRSTQAGINIRLSFFNRDWFDSFYEWKKAATGNQPYALALAAADSRFADIFLAVALASQDADAFPSCRVVIEQFDRLERHHEQVGSHRGTPPARSGF